MPPTLRAMTLGLTFFPRAPNPDLDRLATEADRYLPSSPLGSGYINDRELELKIIGDWVRHFTTRPMGMADGTGLGHLHLSLPTARRLFALWFQTILDCRTTKLHRVYLRSGTFRFTAKPNKSNPDEPYPANPDDVKSIRSIAITPAARRATAGLLASRYTNHNREIYIHHRQYGLVPSGMEAAARKCLLDTDLRPKTRVQVALDLENAHTSAARLSVFYALSKRYSKTNHPLDLAVLMYFLCYYHDISVKYIQVGNVYKVFYQTDALDQGEGMAAHSFGYTIVTIMAAAVRSLLNDVTDIFIHDDVTFGGEVFTDPTGATHIPGNPLDPSLTPIPHAIQLFQAAMLKYMRTKLAASKTICYQPLLPLGHPCTASSFAHLFPAGTTFTNASHRLAGCDVAHSDTLHIPLAAALVEYEKILDRLVKLPVLKTQVKAMILTIAARPSSKFGHHLRYYPPSTTTTLALPPDPLANPQGLPYAVALRDLCAKALAKILRLPATFFIKCDRAIGTLFQLFLPAANGGAALPDPLLLADPAFLSSFIATLSMLINDPFLRSYLENYQDWASSPSPTLQSVVSAFNSIISLPGFSLSSNSSLQRSLATFLLNDNYQYCLSRLSSISHLRTQTTLSSVVFDFVTAAATHVDSNLSDLAKCGILASAEPGATSYFSAYFIPRPLELTDSACITLYAIRLRFHPPGTKRAPEHTRLCHPKCSHYKVKEIPEPQALYGIHFFGCPTAGNLSLTRHNAILRLIAKCIRHELTALTDMEERRLASSVEGGGARTKVDLIVSCPDMSPPVLCIDVTFINTSSSSKWRRALKGSARLIDERVEYKNGKHLRGCIQRERGFLPIVWTVHGGIGPPMAKLWLDSIFNHSYTKERIAGGSGIETSKRKNAFFQSLHACHTIGTTMLIGYCCNPPESASFPTADVAASSSAAPPPPPFPLNSTCPSPTPSSPDSSSDSHMSVN